MKITAQDIMESQRLAKTVREIEGQMEPLPIGAKMRIAFPWSQGVYIPLRLKNAIAVGMDYEFNNVVYMREKPWSLTE